MPYSRVQGQVAIRARASSRATARSQGARVISYVRDQVIAINVLGPLCTSFLSCIRTVWCPRIERHARYGVGRTRGAASGRGTPCAGRSSDARVRGREDVDDMGL
jgi:hypothetical protein